MEITSIIAINLKNLRTERNLSLGQLSTLSGVSKVMLSQIEKGDTNPTINVIWKIANGLKVPYTALLEQNETESEVLKKSDLINQNGDNDHYRIYCYYPNTPVRNFELFQFELDSGCEHISIGHSPKSQEYIMVLEGELTLTVEDKKYILRKDDSIEFNASYKHIYSSTGSENLKVICINYYPHK